VLEWCKSQTTLIVLGVDMIPVYGRGAHIVGAKISWVLKKTLNGTAFHLRVCVTGFLVSGLTKWWPAEPVLSAD
jgi:hypothetical protein